jgi:putative transposase
MHVMRAAKFRLDPTPEQSIAFGQWAGAFRFVYNAALEQRRDWYRPGRQFNYLRRNAGRTDADVLAE